MKEEKEKNADPEIATDQIRTCTVQEVTTTRFTNNMVNVINENLEQQKSK